MSIDFNTNFSQRLETDRPDEHPLFYLEGEERIRELFSEKKYSTAAQYLCFYCEKLARGENVDPEHYFKTAFGLSVQEAALLIGIAHEMSGEELIFQIGKIAFQHGDFAIFSLVLNNPHSSVDVQKIAQCMVEGLQARNQSPRNWYGTSWMFIRHLIQKGLAIQEIADVAARQFADSDKSVSKQALELYEHLAEKGYEIERALNAANRAIYDPIPEVRVAALHLYRSLLDSGREDAIKAATYAANQKFLEADWIRHEALRTYIALAKKGHAIGEARRAANEVLNGPDRLNFEQIATELRGLCR